MKIEGHAIWFVVEFVLGTIVVFILSKISVDLFSSVFTSIEPYRNWIVILATAAILLIAILLYGKFNKYRPHYEALDFDFSILETEIVYVHEMKNKMVYTKKKKVKTLKSGLDRYSDKYHWTGRGTLSLSTPISGHKVIETIKKSVWQYYEIKFPRVLKEGEEVQTEVVWTLEDKANVAVPFVSSTISEPTDLLKITLRTPENLGVTRATKEISCSIEAKKPIREDDLILHRGEGTWEVENPKLFHHYELRWDW